MYKRPVKKHTNPGSGVLKLEESPTPKSTVEENFPNALNWQQPVKEKEPELADWAGARFRNPTKKPEPVNMRVSNKPVRNYPIRKDALEISPDSVVETTSVNNLNLDYGRKVIDTAQEASVNPRIKIEDEDLVRNYALDQKQKEVEAIDRLYKQYTPETEAETRNLQKELIAKGYDLPKYGADGKFGNETKAAYQKYLKDKNTKDTSGLAKELTKSKCDKDGCAEYVSGVLGNTVLGDAWEMKGNIEKGGGAIKYNIYDEPELKRASTKADVIKATDIVKSRSKATKDMFKVGDVVGLFYRTSDMHDVAIKNGKAGTKNTHVGTVTAIKDGVPIISHNIHGNLHHDPFTKLTIGWVGQPGTAERIYSNDREAEVTDINSAVDVYAETLQQDLGVNVDPEIVKSDIRGILSVETGTGRLKPTEKDVKKSKILKTVLGQDPDGGKNVSKGIAKMKENTFSDKEKRFLGLDQVSINDDKTSIKAATYLYLKNYKLFEQYAQKNPQLGLTPEDVRSMTIMAHNQGTRRLRNLGYLSDTKTFDEEVASLRALNDSNVNDVSSTNLKYLGEALGQTAYDIKYPEGHPSYIKRVRKYGAEKTQKLADGSN